MEITSTECLCLAFVSLLAFSVAMLMLWVMPDPCLVSSVLNLRNEAQAIASCTTPACQMKAAKTDLMLSATEGLIASMTGPVYSW